VLVVVLRVVVVVLVIVVVVTKKIFKSLSIVSKDIFSFFDNNPNEEILLNDSFRN
jgi:hypothetical protein